MTTFETQAREIAFQLAADAILISNTSKSADIGVDDAIAALTRAHLADVLAELETLAGSSNWRVQLEDRIAQIRAEMEGMNESN